MSTQLRIYTINRNSLSQFAREWKQQVYPLRLAHSFQIDGAWTIEQTNQFVWIMSYDGPEPWDQKEQIYYSSTARRSMDPDPARLIARPDQYFMTTVQ